MHHKHSRYGTKSNKYFAFIVSHGKLFVWSVGKRQLQICWEICRSWSSGCPQPKGEGTHIKSDRRAPTNTSNQGTISDNLLAKKGSLSDRYEKGVIGCETAQNLANFNNVFFFQIWQNLMFLPENFDQKCKNRGSLGVKLWKSGQSVTNQCRKGVCWQVQDVYWLMGMPPRKSLNFTPCGDFGCVQTKWLAISHNSIHMHAYAIWVQCIHNQRKLLHNNTPWKITQNWMLLMTSWHEQRIILFCGTSLSYDQWFRYGSKIGPVAKPAHRIHFVNYWYCECNFESLHMIYKIWKLLD